MNASPIGMLDSGVGGLSVLREVRTLLPHENVIYVADQAHMPYGPRSREELRGFVQQIAHYLRDRGCKMLVIPCNAANAAALHYLRDIFRDWLIVGMEPAIKPAAEHTHSGVVGVITTKATFQGELFASVMDRFAKGVKVETQVCPDFVTLVEAGIPDTPSTRDIVARYLAPLKQAGIDQLVIGCTHFPFLEAYLKEYLGAEVDIVDPAPAVARQVKRVLDSHHLLNPSATEGTTEYLTTGDPDNFTRLIRQLISDQTPAQALHLDAFEL
ncbi:MAG: glutamate racemase [Anaerolineae bacterium]|nr:glutamate racemase [Anaerolineae bacterium]